MSEKIPPIPEANDVEIETEKFYDPTTGEQISKNAFKKLSKAPKKEKKEKPVAKPAAEKKEKKVKEPEQIWVDKTPFGDKKNIDEFPSSYQPAYVEVAWQAWWEKEGFYTPDLEKALKTEAADKFVMVIPPPNVTGSLHLGRYYQMRDYAVCLYDHICSTVQILL